MSAVLVTRGDIDLAPVLASLSGFDDVVVWDNSAEDTDLKVYGRYEACMRAKHDVIYTQDDDAICPAEDVVAGWSSGLLVNVPDGEWPWLAWGAVFHRDMVAPVFDRYLEMNPRDDDLLLWADVIFAHTVGWQTVDLGHRNLPWATAPSRMYHQPDHYTGQARVRERVSVLL